MQKGFLLIWILVGMLIGGGVLFTFFKLKPQPTPVPQNTSTPVPSLIDVSPAPTGAGETTNWKTYTNTELGFFVKYPSQTKITEGGKYSVDGVFVESPTTTSLLDGNMQLSISVEENKNSRTLESLRQEFNGQNPDEDIEGNKIQSFLLDGKSAIRGATGGSKGAYIILSIYKDRIYRLAFEPDINQTGDQILSTFKFTDQTGFEGKACDSRIKDLYFNNLELGANDIVINGTKLKPGEKTKYIKNPYCTADYQLISINNEKAVINFEGGCEAENIKCVEEIQIFCGGIANVECPSGYNCQLDGSYPDAGGKCVKL